MRVSIIGGGGFRVPLICRALLAAGLPIGEIVLYDVSSTRLAVIASVLAGSTGDALVTTTTSLDEALADASLVFAALRVGGLDGRVRDERVPLGLGLLGQETVGAGGLASAARAVPVADAIARRVRELAPGAWVITMTNPAGIVTEVMSAILGNRVIGVCDSPIALVRRACAAAGVDPGPVLGQVADRVEVDYLGLNHLGWLHGLGVDGVSVLPGLLAAPERLALMEEGRLFGAPLLQAMGAIPNEYLFWYYASREAVRDVLAAQQTRGEVVRARQREFYAAAAAGPAGAARLWAAANEERNRTYFAELRTGERAGERDEADVAAGGYESVAAALAVALTRGTPARLILNVPNGGAVSGLDDRTTIELPCQVDLAGPRPLPVSVPSDHELGLMLTVRACERAIAQAALARAEPASRATARELALRAFTLHPLVGSLEAAEALAATVFAENTPPATPSPHW
ncbi:MAG TPA: 6-phospho-beta-glucosidase [Trebonia sp.]|nr:6-phospho-beta-glucosidase [Trebonia sp.]